MWRYDAGRSAASSNALPAELQMLWTRPFSPRVQAWDDPLNLDLMTYDRVFEPIVMDGRLFLGFNDRDKLVALDTETGEELWTTYAEGPVRLPPAGSEGRVYFCSDDGYLYCVDAARGAVLWKFRGAPDAQRAIGNQRLCSAWPARGGPVVRDETVYFAASIWPFMGTFIYALDAETGEVQWVNDSTGAQYIQQPHSAPSFAGVAPQGALVATETMLLLPGGRSVPAAFDRKDGRLRYFEINAGGKGTGGSYVTADEKHFYVHTREKGTRAFDIETGIKTAFMPNEGVLANGRVYSAELVDGKQVIRAYGPDQEIQWEIDADGSGDLILAADRLVAAGQDSISLIRLPADSRSPDSQSPQLERTLAVDGQVERLLVADQKLFAVTRQGAIMAFGSASSVQAARSDSAVAKPPQPVAQQTAPLPNGEARDAEAIVAELLGRGDPQGYAFWFGSSRHPVLESLALNSPFVQLAVVDREPANIDVQRRRFDAAGLYGRVTLHQSEANAFKPPSHVAHMVFVSEELATAGRTVLPKIYEAVRPFGGVLHLLANHDREKLAAQVAALELEQAQIEIGEHSVIVRRVGALPGSADWTHQYGDVANTIKSDDQRVKLPLGVLWFGGSSNLDVLPRHGHGPPEQVIGGRLFIQGMNSLSARDVYTGRVLWKREFDNLGTYDVYYDDTYEDVPLDPKYNQVHIPGANGRGTNYVATADRVYTLEDDVCHALDPATGETLHDFHLPTAAPGSKESWGYIGVYQDVLIGGVGFAMYAARHGLSFEADKELKASKAGFGSKSLDRAASRALVGFDRHTGEQLWTIDAAHSFWHNGIVAGKGKVYCLDKNPQQVEEAMRRRGLANPDSYRIAAFDYRTGQLAWEVKQGIFGTWLGYSEEFDSLLQAGASGSDRLATEVAQGMAVYSGSDGSLIWKNPTLKYAGPCILHHDLIITNANSYTESAGAFYIANGKPKLVKNPLTGELQPWRVSRAYGCNNIIAAENLLTFRSGAAGFYDLLSDSGTGNLGGFKSGCTSNLVVAGGVLNAPDYTRTCSCAYQNQTSLALVHMPEMDLWSVNTAAAVAEHGMDIQQLGINFGAPGDRRDANGLLWLEYPTIADPAPPLGIKLNPEAKYFQHHTSSMADAQLPWVLASGVDGVTDVEISLKLLDEYNLKKGLPVEHADDDAEENGAGSVDLASSDLELIQDAEAQLVGIRFNHINVLPRTRVRSAAIQFTCDEPSSGATSLIITAEDSGNAARFSANNHDLSSRNPTAQEVQWNPAEWTKAGEAGELQRTPDLTPLVQAVIDRPDWQAGNSIVFLIDGVGKRIAASSKGGKATAPRLIMDADETQPIESVAQPSRRFDIRLYSAVPPPLQSEVRIFDVFAGDQCVAENVTLDPRNDPKQASAVVRIDDLALTSKLQLRFVAKQGEAILSGIEILQISP